MKLTDVFVAVQPDVNPATFERDLKKKLDRVDGSRAGRKVGESTGKGYAAGFKGTLGSTFKDTGKVLAGAFAGGAVIGGFKKAIGAASDLNETISKTQIIFGGSASSIIDWSKTSARSFGLSQSAALGAAAQFGDMFQQLGFTQQQSVSTSKSIVELAGDLGSFNNVEPTDVLDRISAAFRGEYDSLQLLIPNINAARVQQVALTQTHKKAASELTAAEKATATLAIVQKDGARAAGDFARTQDGVANQTRIAKAEFENLLTTVGQGLLPVMNGALKVFRGAIPVIGGTVEVISDLPAPVKAAALTVGGLALAVKLLSPVAGIPGKLADSFERMVVVGGKAEVSGGKMALAGSRMASAFKGALMSISPLTVAIGAAATIVALYAKKKQEAKQRVEEFASALEQDSGAIGENTRALVANKLEQSGALQAARELGINLGDVTAAALGNATALDIVNRAIIDQTTATKEQIFSGERNAAEMVNNRDAAAKLSEAVNGSNKEITEATEKQKRLTEATGPAKTAIQDQGNAAATAASKVRTLVADLFELVGVNADAAQSDIAFRDSLVRLTESVKANGKSIGLTTVKGRENRGAVIASIEAAQRHAEAVGKQTGKEHLARQAFERSIPQIRAQAEKLGLNKKEVDKLIASIAKLKPKTVPVTAVVSVVDAISARADANALAGRGVDRRAFGGPVSGVSTGDRSDSELVRATPGEWVIQKPSVRKLERQRPGIMAAINAGAVDVGGDSGAIRISVGKPLKFARGGSIPQVQSMIRATDPLPYIWGGGGPGGYDCSGLTGAAYGVLTGKGGFRGQRYFTTDTIGAAQGFRPGRGTYTVGVTPGRGHMAGNLAGLKFEARSTAAGILVGSAAAPVTSFARQFYLPSAGGVFGGMPELTKRQKSQIVRLISPQISRQIIRELGARQFDSGGEIPPRSVGIWRNNTARAETVTTGKTMDAVVAELRALRRELAAQPVVVAMDGRPVARAVRNQNTRNPGGW